MKESFVAINITVDNVLSNPNGKKIPLLFYYDGKPLEDIDNDDEEIVASLFKDLKFSTEVYKFLNVDSYSTTSFSYFYFEGEETYKESTVDLQDYLNIDIIQKDYFWEQYKDFWKDYVKKIFSYLYGCSYKGIVYEFNENDFNEDIRKCYDLLKIKNPNKIVKETVVNYVRYELHEKYKLNNSNIDFIISEVENILKNKN